MRKIIDENGRIFGKVSIIDLIVLIVVLAVGAAAYLKFAVLTPTSAGAKMEPVTYTLTIRAVRHYTADSLKPGDLLFDKNGGSSPVGTIADIRVEDAKRATATLDGRYVIGDVEGRYDVTLTVSAEALKSGGRYLVNRTYEINVNSVRQFYTKYCAFEATITGIE